MRRSIQLIQNERQRQIDVEGFTPEHDDKHDDGSLAMAAACYAAPVQIYKKNRTNGTDRVVLFRDPWPWDWRWDKRRGDGNQLATMRTRSRTDRIDLLVKAGALIAAEIDRLLREEAKAKEKAKT